MAKRGLLVRDVSRKECPWLSKDLKKRKVVYEFDGYTYGCIGPGGIAVSDKPGKNPFYELPENAIMWDKDDLS